MSRQPANLLMLVILGRTCWDCWEVYREGKTKMESGWGALGMFLVFLFLGAWAIGMSVMHENAEREIKELKGQIVSLEEDLQRARLGAPYPFHTTP